MSRICRQFPTHECIGIGQQGNCGQCLYPLPGAVRRALDDAKVRVVLPAGSVVWMQGQPCSVAADTEISIDLEALDPARLWAMPEAHQIAGLHHGF